MKSPWSDLPQRIKQDKTNNKNYIKHAHIIIKLKTIKMEEGNLVTKEIQELSREEG